MEGRSAPRQPAVPGARVIAEHEQEMHAHRLTTLWAHFANIALGFWLVASPVTFGYLSMTFPADSPVLAVTAERGLPPPEVRNLAMAWSDVLSGVALVVFGALSLTRRWAWFAQWAAAFVGIWLLFAPLLFWTPSPGAYANDTLVGTLAITFSVLVPMMPGMSMKAMALGPDIPPGWDYSPSDWLQRIPIIAMALVGFFIARYLAAYQLGHTDRVWDPFFGDGTVRIITSDVSRAWPVADAGLGATAYMLEALSGAMGSRRRWRTMPWMVAMFGLLVVPLGAISIIFIIIQPIVIGTWCTLCLVQALAMVVMIPYSLDELVAMGQFLVDVRRRRGSLWSNFLHGGVMEGGRRMERSELDGALPAMLRDMVSGGVNYPWTLVLGALIGVWLMFTRLTLEAEGAMANSDHLVGSLVIVVAFSAFAEVARPLRFINAAFGVWLVAAPWVLDGASAAGTVGSVVAGLALVALSLPRGAVRGRYAGWNRLIV